ncbi:ABC transporter ATP-binding protein [Streptomyces sp. JJ36]|uniref:ABC transporter ATP-binding protein n=1 Tax=Streptomyces sp. JJ36 TaxID=2736645 RepID=UPI001F3B961C|nr:ABC transporter ATP-binding protein [Streptomyces sp. JJ36]MCF6524643.1 ABC transporter ATP-binding protein [Streptomyces sp. JJ36]
MTSPGRLILDTVSRARGWMTLAALSALTASAATLALPGALAAALDAVVSGGPATVPVAWFAVALVATALAGSLRALATGGFDARATAVLRTRFSGRVFDAALPGTQRFPAGDLTSRLTGGCAQAGTAGSTLVTAGTSLLTSCGAVVALWVVDWRLGAAFLLVLPPALLIIRLFVHRGSPVFLRYQELQGRLSALFAEAMGGARTVAAGGTVATEVSRVLEPLPELAETGHRTWRLQRDTGWQAGLLFPAIQVLVLALAGHALVDGRISVGQLTAVVGYTTLALGAFDHLDALFSLGTATAGARRVAEILDQPSGAPGTPRAADVPPAPRRGAVTLRGVTVRTAGRTVLDSVDLHIPAGTACALVGRSGSGKSTLAALLGRLRDPDAGAVLLDGVPAGELGPAALHAAVGYAFERPALLGGTVREALTLARPGASEPEIVAAARAARADDFVRRLPHGYDTPLAEAPMSGGEIQRLGLARALLHDPVVVVLDDATSSLDTATEAQVDAALRTAWHGRTRLLVAHRPQTAARADTVVWLEDGRVRATGPHPHLWRDPAYRALFGARGTRPPGPGTRPAASGGSPAKEQSCPRA